MPANDILVLISIEISQGSGESAHVLTLKNNFLHKSKKDGKDQESIQSSTTPDPGYHMGK